MIQSSYPAATPVRRSFLIALACFFAPFLFAAETDDLQLQLDSIQPHAFGDALLDTDRVSGRLTLQIEDTHQGKMASLYLAARYQDSWFIRSAEGWSPWSGNPVELIAYGETQLGSEVEFMLFENELLGAGDYEVFAAFVPENEEAVIAQSSANFSVQDGSVDILHPFRSDQAMEDSELDTEK